jgi:hypothetical protein
MNMLSKAPYYPRYEEALVGVLKSEGAQWSD